ncbi:hypothetical protein ACH5RR_005857 [Cinchona calisaya]|uniref:Polygalacturonase n=1 Tax=Cinchona calisaya TaxID=153742 RepID=A0ABD3AMB8_9GENT
MLHNVLQIIFYFLMVMGSMSSSYNVLDYGAISDGYTDNSQAFLEAWNAACNAETRTPQVVVPEDMTFLVMPVIFEGPCIADKIEFMILGTIVAPSSPGFWFGIDTSQWLVFRGIRGLKVDGFGSIDGQGKGWWDQSCKLHPELEGCTKLAPTALKFLGCNDSGVSNIFFRNSPQAHILTRRCNGFRVDKLMIQSPGYAPNTDGIHIQSSHHLSIINSKISTGDDCISIGDYTSNVEIDNIDCGPGHGISIGSLGRSGNFVQVENIYVTNSRFNGTTNGARIKTWQVGRGYLRTVVFQNLKFINVKNPIIIDQNYCDVRGACKELETGVKISRIIYNAMSGTSSTNIAINLNCSRSVPCSGISMQDIQLASATIGKQVIASCTNADGQEFSVVPGPCLQPKIPI